MENILGRSDYQELVLKSSTNDSTELRDFLKENIGLVKADPSDDHWSTGLPSSVLCIINPNPDYSPLTVTHSSNIFRYYICINNKI